MDLKGIISITGMSGLYKVVAKANNGFIVEALADKKRLPISSNQKISSLEDISIYSQNEDVPLSSIFIKMHEMNGGKLPVDTKSDNKALTSYFKTVLPDYDESRVYVSDIKKVVSWYTILKDTIDFTATPEKENGPEVTSDNDEAKPKLAKKEKASSAKNTPKPKSEGKVATAAKTGTAKTRKKV